MRRRTRAYLLEMKEAAAYIGELTDGHDEATYRSNKMLRQVVERNFEIIGEAMRRLMHHDPDVADQFPDGHKLVALRNVIAHDYDAINDATVWRIVIAEVPRLRTILDRLLDEQPPS